VATTVTATGLPLGQILMDRGLIGPDDLERALELQRERGDKLGKILVDMGFVAAAAICCWRFRNNWA